MNHIFLIFASFFVCQFASAQLVGGDVVKEGRKLAEPSSFMMYEDVEGAIFFRLAVDREGKVTSAQFIPDKSIIISTPLQVRAKQYVSQLLFEPGTYYPKFHSCEVKINLVND